MSMLVFRSVRDRKKTGDASVCLLVVFMCIFRDVYSVGLFGASGTRDARLDRDFSLFGNGVDRESCCRYTLVSELKL